MRGSAFNWLKTGRIGAESAKQPEIRLADLWKILSIAGETEPGGAGMARQRAFIVDFRLKRAVSLISG
jgi:hypothetical protein